MLIAIKKYLSDIGELVEKIPLEELQRIIDVLLTAYENKQFVFIMGNGGSAATASHLDCDLSKGTLGRNKNRRFKVIALTDNIPLITAWANDTHYEHIFSEQLIPIAGAGDVVIGISGSGDSQNVLNAIRHAKTRACITVGITGFEGGLLREKVDHCLIIPSDNMQYIEDTHMILSHLISSNIRDKLLQADYKTGYQGIDLGAVKDKDRLTGIDLLSSIEGLPSDIS